MDIKSLYDYIGRLQYYPEDRAHVDIVGDSGFYGALRHQFGMRSLRGTAVGQHVVGENTIRDKEEVFRKFLSAKPIKHAVEIGTWRGVSSTLIAHYADMVTTIDINFYFDSLNIWNYFGVFNKITCCIMPNKAKLLKLKDLDFDFAFIDGNHDFEYVKEDFGAVKKCGRVLFHDYGCGKECVCVGPTKFVDTLPEDEVTIIEPFAMWERKDG